VVVARSSIGGGLTAVGGGALTVCGSTVAGLVTVKNGGGFVLLGDPDDDACTPNIFKSSVALRSNAHGVEVGHNTITGSLTLAGNHGGGPFLPDDSAPEIEANTIAGSLRCSANSPAARNGGHSNTVGSARRGECSAGSF
jgi:hypothetical protein